MKLSNLQQEFPVAYFVKEVCSWAGIMMLSLDLGYSRAINRVRAKVQAIDLGQCSGDARWQRSLLQSIRNAVSLRYPNSTARAFPPVRTLVMNTLSMSAEELARQLSEPQAE